MVRRDVAGAHLARATTWLDDSERLFGQPPAEFVKAAKDRDLVIFYLFLAIQECIDLAAHWVADEGWSPPDVRARHLMCSPAVAPSTATRLNSFASQQAWAVGLLMAMRCSTIVACRPRRTRVFPHCEGFSPWWRERPASDVQRASGVQIRISPLPGTDESPV